ELFIARPDPAGILHGMLVPHLPASAVYVAVGMVGATVMPHVVYLHSGLVQHRNRILAGESRTAHFRRELIDIVLAMNGAFLLHSLLWSVSGSRVWSLVIARPPAPRAGRAFGRRPRLRPCRPPARRVPVEPPLQRLQQLGRRERCHLLQPALGPGHPDIGLER